MTARDHEGSPGEHDVANRYVEDPRALWHAGRGLGQRYPGSPRHHRDQRKKCDHAPHYTRPTSKIIDVVAMTDRRRASAAVAGLPAGRRPPRTPPAAAPPQPPI